jgi:hypothetical protein
LTEEEYAKLEALPEQISNSQPTSLSYVVHFRFCDRIDPGRIAKRFEGVDDFEDAQSRAFQKAQPRSTSCPHLIETKRVENGRLSQQAVNCLERSIASD